MKLALAQINTKLADVQSNLDKHLSLCKEAWKNQAELIIFPELSLTGYTLQDLASTVAIRANETDPIFKQLLHASEDLDIIFGFVEEDPRFRFYISAAYLSEGKLIHLHRKVYPPTYGIFDEKRFFAEGDSFRAFDTRFGRVGILICEDFWHISSPYTLWLDGADIFYLISASPGRGVTDEKLGSATWVETVNQTYAGLFTSFFAHVNRVGFEDGLNFWGGATVFNPDGKLIGKAPYNDEALTFVELDLNQLKRTRARLPLLRDEKAHITAKELKRILKK
jgi:predicted amidohydrolase